MGYCSVWAEPAMLPVLLSFPGYAYQPVGQCPGKLFCVTGQRNVDSQLECAACAFNLHGETCYSGLYPFLVWYLLSAISSAMDATQQSAYRNNRANATAPPSSTQIIVIMLQLPPRKLHAAFACFCFVLRCVGAAGRPLAYQLPPSAVLGNPEATVQH